ncbi:deleted in malignant brain tumors 1 protein-like isoform X2 [Mizuhopecten yessoensis]|uniref:deleted in malignant brain tumors 1 protein-like isoform X2 n=1 Tax=Mizuhopecten yessoensis TaxID=6573 RepID=UPI000B45861B|nr:deleted in malignant brain tumors 1 protein-like isoform X2 [Mizuhopecten yessoensis]
MGSRKMLVVWVLVLTAVGSDCVPLQAGRTLHTVSRDVADPPSHQLMDFRRRNHVHSCRICPFIPGARVMCVHYQQECDVHEDRCFRSLGVQSNFHGFSYTKIDYDGREAWARTETTVRSCAQGSHGDGSVTYHPMLTHTPSVETTTTPMKLAFQTVQPPSNTAHSVHAALMSNMGVNTHEGVLIITVDGIDHVACADGWTEENSRVVCKTIGSPQGYVASHRAVQDYGIPVLSEQVTCNGLELDLSMCPRHRQTHCPNNRIIQVTCTVTAPLYVSLVSNTGARTHEGILIITTGSKDHVTCANGWTEENSRVVCKTIGAPQGHITSHHAFQNYGIPVFNEQIACNGWERDLSKCPRHRDYTQTQCLNNYVIYVTCSVPASTVLPPSTTQTSTTTPTTTTPATTSTTPTTTITTTTTPTTTSTTPTTTTTTTQTTTSTTTRTTPTTSSPTTTGHWINFGGGKVNSTSAAPQSGWVPFG